MRNKREIEIAVPKSNLQQWKMLYHIGDKKELYERNVGTKQVIANAFKGFATLTVIHEINAYYATK